MGSGDDKNNFYDISHLSQRKRKIYLSNVIKSLKDEKVATRKHVAKLLGDIGDKTVIPHLKTALGDEDESVQINAQESIDKIMEREKEASLSKVSTKTGPSKNIKQPMLIGLGVIVFIIITLIVISSVASQPNTKPTTPASSNNNQVDVNFSNLSNASTASPPITSTPSSSSSNSGEDYDKGYDTGYQNGVDDAYYKDPYYDGTSSTLQVSEWWKEGYKTGYKQGYNTIKNGGSLQRPQLSYNAYMDPRTEQTIQ